MIACSTCGREGEERPESMCSLPANYEHSDPHGLVHGVVECRAVSVNGRSPAACDTDRAVCGWCVLDLLDRLLEAARGAYSGG